MLSSEGIAFDAKTEATQLETISKRLVGARLAAEPLSRFPGNLPESLAAAYGIQSLSITAWPDEISGWKVGGVPDAFQERFGAKRLCGPIFRAATHSVMEGETTSMPVFAGGFAAIEAEFVVETAVPIAPGEIDVTASDMMEMISTVYIGAETASSPMTDINRLGPVAIISDFGNNGGLVLGPEIREWRDRAADTVSIDVTVNGERVGRIKSAMTDGVFAAIEFLIDMCGKRGIHLPAGTLVSCGALSGIHDVTVGSVAQVYFEGLGSFGVEFTERQPAV